MITQRTAFLSLGLGLALLTGLGTGCAVPPSATSSTPGVGAASVLKRMDALEAGGRHDDVLALVDQELARPQSAEMRARLELARGKALVGTGRGQSGLLAMQRALTALRSTRSPLVREIHVAWGDAAMRIGRFQEAADHYQLGLEGERLARKQREELYYAIYVSLHELGDPDAAHWKDEILLFSPEMVARTEERLLGRKPPPPVAVTTLPILPSTGIPTDPRELLSSIHTRAEWGAAAIRGKYDRMTPITRMTVHHSALDTSPSGAAPQVAAEIRQIQSSHQQKWADIGYHFLIDRSGGIWEGRNLQWQGAHEGAGLNQGAIGICLLGNFEQGPPTAQQLGSLKQLMDACRSRWHLTAADIKTHKEVRPEPTECPGWALQGWVDDYRRSLALTSLARQ